MIIRKIYRKLRNRKRRRLQVEENQYQILLNDWQNRIIYEAGHWKATRRSTFKPKPDAMCDIHRAKPFRNQGEAIKVMHEHPYTDHWHYPNMAENVMDSIRIRPLDFHAFYDSCDNDTGMIKVQNYLKYKYFVELEKKTEEENFGGIASFTFDPETKTVPTYSPMDSMPYYDKDTGEYVFKKEISEHREKNFERLKKEIREREKTEESCGVCGSEYLTTGDVYCHQCGAGRISEDNNNNTKPETKIKLSRAQFQYIAGLKKDTALITKADAKIKLPRTQLGVPNSLLDWEKEKDPILRMSSGPKTEEEARKMADDLVKYHAQRTPENQYSTITHSTMPDPEIVLATPRITLAI